ncbi:MAG: hypothetical protein QXP45_04010 [Thermoproteota archaeon]
MEMIEGLDRFVCVKRMLENVSLLSRSGRTRETYSKPFITS